MELHKVFSLLLQNFVLIIIVILLLMILAGVISTLFIAPKYEAKSTLIINKTSGQSKSTEYDYSDILLTQSLVNTYSIIIISDAVLTQVINNVGHNISPDDLRKNLIVQGIDDTEIISISVKDTIPKRAVDVVNEITRVCPEEIIRIANVGSVEVIDRAVLPKEPISPNISLNIVLAGLMGFILTVLFILAKDQLDKTIKSQEDIETLLGLPVLGQLPKH